MNLYEIYPLSGLDYFNTIKINLLSHSYKIDLKIEFK